MHTRFSAGESAELQVIAQCTETGRISKKLKLCRRQLAKCFVQIISFCYITAPRIN